MSESDEDWFDADIAAMKLGYGEKAGLQIYRNYTEAFDEQAVKRFVQTIDLEPLNLTDFLHLVDLIIREEARFLPVIVCAFADDLLKATFKEILPDGIPGGKERMLGGFGPLSDFGKRIQLAYAFDVLSPDLMQELDRLRVTRNEIAHSWNIDSLDDFFTKGRIADMYRMEELLPERQELAEEFLDGFKPLTAFRVRLVWIVGRLAYEAAGYNRAKKIRVSPAKVLYGKPTPKWLGQIARECLRATRDISKQA
jgi:hypothetical protein